MREKMKAHEALSIAHEVMEQVRRLTAHDMLANGDRFAFDRIVDLMDISDEAFGDAQHRIAELQASMDSVKCAHCEDPEAHDEDAGTTVAPDDPAQAACSNCGSTETHYECPVDWERLDEERCQYQRLNKMRDIAAGKGDLLVRVNVGTGEEEAFTPDEMAQRLQDAVAHEVFARTMANFDSAQDIIDAESFRQTPRRRRPRPTRRRGFPRLPWFQSWLREDIGSKHWHTDIGLPPGFDIEKYRRNLPDTLVGSDHYEERRSAKGLPRTVARDWAQKARLITISMKDGRLVRYAVRGVWTTTRDLTVVIEAATGTLITGWFNQHDDWHRLDGGRVQYEQP